MTLAKAAGLRVVPVRAVQTNRKRQNPAVANQTALAPALGPVGGVGTCKNGSTRSTTDLKALNDCFESSRSAKPSRYNDFYRVAPSLEPQA